MSERKVLEEVQEEMERQDAKWGEQNHDPFLYLTILSEEIGEVAQAALDLRYPGGKKPGDLRFELIQVAAVAASMVECLDREKWRWGGHAS